jgi:acetylornithine/succinyldiaminopimelate/putrescine aminotransferase
MTALQVIQDEGLSANAEKMGELLRRELATLPKEKVPVVRGKGLLNAIVIDKSKLPNYCCRVVSRSKFPTLFSLF